MSKPFSSCLVTYKYMRLARANGADHHHVMHWIILLPSCCADLLTNSSCFVQPWQPSQLLVFQNLNIILMTSKNVQLYVAWVRILCILIFSVWLFVMHVIFPRISSLKLLLYFKTLTFYLLSVQVFLCFFRRHSGHFHPPKVTNQLCAS